MKNDLSLLESLVKATESIQANPQDAEAYLTRAALLHAMQRDEDALEDLDYLIDELGRKVPAAILLRGRIKMERGDKVGAMEDVRMAASLDPHLFDGLEGTFETKESGHC